MKSLILASIIIAMLIRIVIVTKDGIDYEKERSEYQKDNKHNAVIIPISDTAYGYIPEYISHRNFMRKKKVSSLRKYNPLAYKFITEDNEKWNLSVLNFHGQLIDQFKNPIPNANLGIVINYRNGNAGFFGGGAPTRNYSVYAKTDKNGNFVLDKVVGKDFSVIVISAEGYFFNRYLYSRDKVNKANTTSSDPYVIKGWKIENPSSLENVDAKILGFPNKVKPNNDGRPYTVFLKNKSDDNFVEGNDGDITISVTTNNDGAIAREDIKSNYSIYLHNGGLVEVEDRDYPYMAPVAGYQSSIKQSFEYKDLGNSKGRGVHRGTFYSSYYIKLQDPIRFGFLDFRITPDFRGKLSYSATFRINELGTRELLRELDLDFSKRKENFTYAQYYFDFEKMSDK